MIIIKKIKKQTKKKPNDFEFISLIGRGAYGEVKLVREKETNKVYAMKEMKKAEMVKKIK